MLLNKTRKKYNSNFRQPRIGCLQKRGRKVTSNGKISISKNKKLHLTQFRFRVNVIESRIPSPTPPTKKKKASYFFKHLGS